MATQKECQRRKNKRVP